MNYKTCTIEELIEHIKSNTTQAVTQQLMYYRSRGVVEVVEKIQKARLLVKQMKVAAQLERLA